MRGPGTPASWCAARSGKPEFLVNNGGSSSVNYPLLAVNSGQIALAATGSVTIAGVVNPAEIHHQAGSFADPFADSGVVNSLYMDTYGPNSGASILAVGGNLTIDVAPVATFYQARDLAYPSSFAATALSGDIKTTGMVSVLNAGIVLSGSPGGTFQLLAQGSIDLTGGFSATTTPGGFRPTFSAGPSLLDAAFNPFRPNDGFDERSSRAVLAHQDDAEVAHIYALTGDISRSRERRQVHQQQHHLRHPEGGDQQSGKDFCRPRHRGPEPDRPEYRGVGRQYGRGRSRHLLYRIQSGRRSAGCGSRVLRGAGWAGPRAVASGGPRQRDRSRHPARHHLCRQRQLHAGWKSLCRSSEFRNV